MVNLKYEPMTDLEKVNNARLKAEEAVKELNLAIQEYNREYRLAKGIPMTGRYLNGEVVQQEGYLEAHLEFNQHYYKTYKNKKDGTPGKVTHYPKTPVEWNFTDMYGWNHLGIDS